MTSATVWAGSEERELARVNSEKYVAKRWKNTTKQCCITITGRKHGKGTSIAISVYTSDRDKVGEFAEELLGTAIRGDSKPYFIIIELYDYMASHKEKYTDDIKTVEEEYKNREQYLIQRFKDDPRVKALTHGEKPIEVYPTTRLHCGLESEKANKIIVEAIDEYFPHVLSVMRFLTEELIERGLAKRVIGYGLSKKNMEKLDIISVEEIETGELIQVVLGFSMAR